MMSSSEEDLLDPQALPVAKRKAKAPPLSVFEKTLLLEYVQEKKSIIESKASDPKTIVKKQKAWDKIAEEFSANPDVIKRTGPQLKKAWENAKTRAKNEVSFFKF